MGARFDLPAEAIADSIIQSAKEFTGGQLRDDVALVSLRLEKPTIGK